MAQARGPAAAHVIPTQHPSPRAGSSCQCPATSSAVPAGRKTDPELTSNYLKGFLCSPELPTSTKAPKRRDVRQTSTRTELSISRRDADRPFQTNLFPSVSTLKLKAESHKRQRTSEQLTHPYPDFWISEFPKENQSQQVRTSTKDPVCSRLALLLRSPFKLGA